MIASFRENIDMAQNNSHKNTKKSSAKRLRHLLMLLLVLVGILAVLLAAVTLQKRQNTDTVEPAETATEKETNALPDETEPKPSENSVPEDSADSGQPETSAASGSAVDEEAAQEDVTLLFTGDVLLSDYVCANYDREGISGVLDETLLDAMTSADVTTINNEFPFSTRGTQAADKQFTFRVNPSYVSALTDMGVDIAGLANNHVLDYGADALNDTFETLDAAGIDYMGAGTDLSRASALITRQISGQTIGFLAASRVIPVVSWDIKNASPGVFTTYDPALLLEAIAQAKETCDYVVVLVHWGIERNEYPEDYETELAHQYIDAGADLIIGSHPHVLQGISYYKGKPIFYSLGNFIFNQSIPKTMAVSVTLSDSDTPLLQLIPAAASDARTASLTGAAATAVFDYVESISDGISIDENGMVVEK
jgi:poly-gamma-glutamate synthesis protein (capsule biosynthesis protein)